MHWMGAQGLSYGWCFEASHFSGVARPDGMSRSRRYRLLALPKHLSSSRLFLSRKPRGLAVVDQGCPVDSRHFSAAWTLRVDWRQVARCNNNSWTWMWRWEERRRQRRGHALSVPLIFLEREQDVCHRRQVGGGPILSPGSRAVTAD